MFRLLFLVSALALSPAAAGSAPKIGTPAPTFNLPSLFQNGAGINLASLQGKVVLIDFWASWCAPCGKTLPELAHIHKQNPALSVLAISVDESRNKAMDFLRGKDTSLIYLHDFKRETAEKFALGGMPSAYLIDKKGMLRKRFDGYTADELKSVGLEARKLLEENP